MTDVVFVGPTLTPDEVCVLLPGAVVEPPVRHGDLLRLHTGPGDRVFLIDGLFLQVAPVRHREVLDLLGRGVTVAGSSSMGALRAAELWPFGMRGIGRVFEMYRDGVVTCDDEVAVLYGPAEDGYPQLSRPLVDLRHSLDAATALGVLDRAHADGILAAARALSFRVRGRTAIERAARDAVPGPVTERYLRWARDRPVDLKADDARLMLGLAASGSPLLVPPGPADRRPEHLDTSLLRAWRARHHGTRRAGRLVPDRAAAAVVMAWHPRFPDALRRRVLEHLVGPGPDLEARAVALARRRGLQARDGLRPDGWLRPAEHDLPPDEQLVRLLVRAFGVHHCRGQPLEAIPPELNDSATLDRARRFARRSAEVNEHLPRRPEGRFLIRPDVIDEVLRRAWRCRHDELEAFSMDRGFRGLGHLRTVIEPVVSIAAVTGEEPFR